MDVDDEFTLQVYLIGNKAIEWLPQCERSNPEVYEYNQSEPKKILANEPCT